MLVLRATGPTGVLRWFDGGPIEAHLFDHRGPLFHALFCVIQVSSGVGNFESRRP